MFGQLVVYTFCNRNVCQYLPNNKNKDKDNNFWLFIYWCLQS